MRPLPPRSTLFPYTTLFPIFDDGHCRLRDAAALEGPGAGEHLVEHAAEREEVAARVDGPPLHLLGRHVLRRPRERSAERSEEHTSELQSQSNLVCRLLLEKKK